MPDFVLDSHAVLAFLFGEPGAPEVRGILEEAARAEQALLMSVVNWAEALCRIRRHEGHRGVARAGAFAEEMRITIAEADVALAEAAAEFKAEHRMSLADAFAAALAQREDAELVTGDPELRPLKGIIKLRWIG